MVSVFLFNFLASFVFTTFYEVNAAINLVITVVVMATYLTGSCRLSAVMKGLAGYSQVVVDKISLIQQASRRVAAALGLVACIFLAQIIGFSLYKAKVVQPTVHVVGSLTVLGGLNLASMGWSLITVVRFIGENLASSASMGKPGAQLSTLKHPAVMKGEGQQTHPPGGLQQQQQQQQQQLQEIQGDGGQQADSGAPPLFTHTLRSKFPSDGGAKPIAPMPLPVETATTRFSADSTQSASCDLKIDITRDQQ